MPPKRKAAAIASDVAPRRTLRDTFKSVSKTASLPGKAAAATATKKRKLEDAVIVQNGDEDVLVTPMVQKAKEPVKEKEQEPVKEKDEEPVKEKEEEKTATIPTPAPTPTPSKKAKTGTRATPARATRGKKKAAATAVKASTITVKEFFKPRTQTTTETDPSATTVVSVSTVTSIAATTVTESTSNDTNFSATPSEDDPESIAYLPRFHRALITAVLLHHTTSSVSPLFSALLPTITSMTRRTLPQSTLLRIIQLSPYLRLEAPPLRILLARPSPSLEAQCSEFTTQLASYTSLSSIPEATIEKAVDLAAPLRARGKAIAATLKGTTKTASSKGAGTQKTLLQSGMKVSSRASSLMERIKEKQARAAAAPTVEEKATLLATARVPEVMDILKAMRSKGESKALGEVVDLVRGSIKRPISKSEAEEAIRILGKREGNWLEIRQVGGVAAVVFKKDLAAKRFI